MSTTYPTVPTARTGSWRQDLRAVRIVRLAIGATLAMLLAQIFNWPLSFVAPALVVAFLEMPIPQPSLGDFAEYLAYAVLSVVGGFVFVMLFEPYPLIFVVAYTLAIFLSAYFLHQGAPFVLILFSWLVLLIFPIVGNVHEGVTVVVAGSVLFSKVIALFIIQLVYGILPDPPGTPGAETPAFARGYSAHAARAAAQTALVMVPAMIAFLVFNWPSKLVIMLYIGIIALEGSLAHSIYDVKKYLTANAIGGIGALLFYLVVVVVPEVHMLALVTLLTTLLFSSRRFSEKAGAKYFGSALIGLLILISQSVGEGAVIDVNIVLRVAYIFVAGMYAIAAMYLYESLLDRLGLFGGHDK